MICSAAVTCLAAAGPPGRALTFPGSLLILLPMFFVGSRVRVIGLTGGKFVIAMWISQAYLTNRSIEGNQN